MKRCESRVALGVCKKSAGCRADGAECLTEVEYARLEEDGVEQGETADVGGVGRGARAGLSEVMGAFSVLSVPCSPGRSAAEKGMPPVTLYR